MNAVRFGSYSMPATLAGIPSLLRLKSITRYLILLPPPPPLMANGDLAPAYCGRHSSSCFPEGTFPASSW